jgi:hypothetical protein
MSQILQLRAELHHVHLKYKKEGDVGSHALQSDKVQDCTCPTSLTEVWRKHGVTPFVWRKETLT